ncbi:tartrate transporter [Coccidioides immitis RMSCC 2394]|uniref:Tartrate transporter n=1 Tax=Coccidioides immitis RMSCC 2394 TaxID=404692 RepID=A0A0J6Y8L6_COCIT|nr:tartrate transporter [Coccidioides immitis RMSCC 2394]
MADTRDGNYIHNVDDISGLEHQRDELNCHKKHSMVENEELKEDTVRVSDQKAECALCLKFDIRILPVLAIMYLFNALDKGNIGNAQTAGLSKGMAEAAFFPLVIYYLTTFYRRGELARRLAIFYAASNIANAFSGLLSFGVFQVKSGKLKEWRYLFLIEGACTVIFAIFAYWYLPQAPAEARFLDPKEKALAFHRIQVDSSSIVNEKFNFREALTVFKQPTSYIFLAIEVCIGVPIQSVALFLPQIIQRLERDTVTTNLYTVAPNCTGAVMLLILAFSSDACRLRSPFIAFGFLLSFTGFMIYAAIDDVKAQFELAYYACFMMTWGTSAPSVLLSTWYNNNIAHENRRMLLTSVGVPIANLMGLVSSNIFREEDKPKYKPALITTGTFGAAGALLAGSLGVYMAWDNRQRNKKQGVKIDTRDIPTKHLRDGPDTPEFRWFL